ncbi:sensor domain-containing diguanylate cyclase [Neiella sp. HB171785]|uniref:diguanylate cyclase n=1 Tax=Neiella litorisoli TaxID=2771431 RepID=A0A8J6UDK6_9GAMM|nr:sensor domain-containing diguanylate cyclase [Neiella litorisoli]MBD1388064.1 sensor domain-containing diguanylate cyclase [Neiella litorisoli]
MLSPSSSEAVIRRLYQITQDYERGFEHQITELIRMGLTRFKLDIGILSHVVGELYTVDYCVVPDGIELKKGDEFDFKSTYCAITCKAKGPVAIENMGQDDRYASHPAYQAFGLESYIGIPIRFDGQVYGTLNFSSAIPYTRQFEEIDIDALQLMASWIEVELIRRKQEQQLEALNQKLKFQAYYDSLTNIPNRRGMFKHMMKELNRASRNQSQGSLSLVDIDFFKRVNDTYGHSVGDQVLQQVAQTISEALREYDYVARLGGEEFVLWFPDTNEADNLEVCRRIMASIKRIERLPEPLTVSIGSCQLDCKNCNKIDAADTLADLLEKADKALYQAKADGRNRLVRYEDIIDVKKEG